MSGRSFPYHKLKKLPPPPPPAGPATPDALELEQDHQDHPQQPSPSSVAAIQESYHSYYRALSAAVVGRGRRHHHQGATATAAAGTRRRRLRRPRLRISRLARALRRKAAAVGGCVRTSVARVARRLLTEGRPYIGDLFAGNYMFLQVAPSPTMLDGGKKGAAAGGFAPFTEYYYAARARNKGAAAGVVYRV